MAVPGRAFYRGERRVELGGTDAEHFASGRAGEEREMEEMPQQEAAEVAAVLRSYD